MLYLAPFSLFKASCKGQREALREDWGHMLHLFKTAKTISGSRGEEATIKIIEETIRLGVKGGAQDTD